MQPPETPTAIVTGASSGLGLHATRALVARGWHVVMACRDLSKAGDAIHRLAIDPASASPMHLDLGSLVYLPQLKPPMRWREGYEIRVATNHLGRFLLANLMLDDLRQSRAASRRSITLGTITANTAESAGRIPIPAPAHLGELAGRVGGFKAPIAMLDGGRFRPGKAYKDTALFGHTPAPFRALLPAFQKYVTRGYVAQALAGERIAQVVGLSPAT